MNSIYVASCKKQLSMSFDGGYSPSMNDSYSRRDVKKHRKIDLSSDAKSLVSVNLTTELSI